MNASPNTKSINSGAAALWASALVIAALIIVQAGRLSGAHNAAHAGMQGDRGDYTLLTASAGTGPETDPNDIFCVLDSREQILLVYEVEDAQKKQVVLRDVYQLDNLFLRARQ